MFAAPLPHHQSVLVGRDRELGILRQHRDAAMGGHGSLVLIGGEAGIGKTALAEALCQEATERDTLVLVGRCYDLTETPPYGPWVDLFGRYRQDDGMPAVPDVFAQRGTVGEVTSQASLFQQVLDFFATLAALRPVVLLLDDSHWADVASLDLLRFLARTLTEMPLLVLLTYRSDELTQSHPLAQLLPTLVREAHAARLTLPRWQTEDVTALVRVRYGLPVPDAARLVTYLVQRADGNPFFTGEVLHTLEEERALRHIGGQWHVGDLAGTRVPTLVQQVIERRLARLDAEAQRLLIIAAVIGQDVPLALWAAVAQCAESGLLVTVEQAVAAHVFAEMPDGTGLRFVHALIRETLYQSIPLPARRAQHGQVAEVLLTLPSPDPDAVAAHLQRAGDARAGQWLLAAGERADRVHASLTAAERFTSALTLLTEYDLDPSARGWLLVRIARFHRFADPQAGIAPLEEASRLAAEANDPVLAADAVFFRGILRCRMQDFRRGMAEMRAGVAATAVLPLTEQQCAHPADNPGAVVDEETTRGSLALWLAQAGYYEEARTTATRVTARNAPMACDDSPEAAPHMEAYFGLGFVHAAMGRPAAAHAAFTRARYGVRARRSMVGIAETALNELEWVTLPYDADRLAERQALATEAAEAWAKASGALRADDPVDLPFLPLLVLEGRWSEAYPLAVAARAARGWSQRQLVAVRALGALARHRGQADLGWSLIQEWLPADHPAAPGDVRYLDALVLQRLAAALALDAGEMAVARTWLERHDAWLAWGGVVLGLAEGQALWARYHEAVGDSTRAQQHAERALAHATAPRQPLALLAAHRLLGELALAAGHHANARLHLDDALALADACQAPFEHACTLLVDAELQAAMGCIPEAQALLEKVRTVCMPLGALPTLARADALATRLASRAAASRAPTHPAGLTDREMQVLRLLVGGQTNKEIGAALFVTEKTVEMHVTRILTKLNAPNRAAAAVLAVQQGIV